MQSKICSECNKKCKPKFAMISEGIDNNSELYLCKNCLTKITHDSRYDSTNDLFKKYQMISNEK